MTRAADDFPNVLILHVLFLLTCTAIGNSDNSGSSNIFMVLFVEWIEYDKRGFLLFIKGVFYECNKSTQWNILINHLFFRWNILVNRLLFSEKIGGSCKYRRDSTGKQIIFSHSHIFQTHLHMNKTIYASIQ